MIDFRQKRQDFHQNIRNNQRQAFRAKIRKQISIQNKRQQVQSILNESFSFCHEWDQNKQNFWKLYFNPIGDHKRAYQLIDEVCVNLKFKIGQYEKDENIRVQISHYLIQNLKYLIPPCQISLLQFPKSLIQLCIYILKDSIFSVQEKENFVDSMPYKTVNKCLLGYFEDNWAQMKNNKCNDLTMIFFNEITKFRNIFKCYDFNDNNYDFLLGQLAKQIMALTHYERMAYDKSNFGFDDKFEPQSVQKSWHYEQNFYNFMENPFSQQEKIFYLMKNSVFLCNLILLRPINNFTLKELKYDFKNITSYLYRSVFLNEDNLKYKMSAQFCISTLLIQTVQSRSTNYILNMREILKSETKRARQRNRKQNMQIQIDQQNISKYQSVECENIAIMNQSSSILLNKINLLMIHSISQTQKLTFSSIQSWLKNQLQSRANNIFALQNSDIISCLLKILKNILTNQMQLTYKSYGFNRRQINNRNDQVMITRLKISKMIRQNGFNQMFNHYNSRYYCNDLCDLLVCLMNKLDQIGEISTIIKGLLIFNGDDLELQEINPIQYQQNQSYDDQQNQQDRGQKNMITYKTHLYSLSVNFLQRTYKYLTFDKKQKILLHLILDDYYTFQDCRKYLTLEEIIRLRSIANSTVQDSYSQFIQQQAQNNFYHQQTFNDQNDETYFCNLNCQNKQVMNYEKQSLIYEQINNQRNDYSFGRSNNGWGHQSHYEVKDIEI